MRQSTGMPTVLCSALVHVQVLTQRKLVRLARLRAVASPPSIGLAAPKLPLCSPSIIPACSDFVPSTIPAPWSQPRGCRRKVNSEERHPSRDRIMRSGPQLRFDIAQSMNLFALVLPCEGDPRRLLRWMQASQIDCSRKTVGICRRAALQDSTCIFLVSLLGKYLWVMLLKLWSQNSGGGC